MVPLKNEGNFKRRPHLRRLEQVGVAEQCLPLLSFLVDLNIEPGVSMGDETPALMGLLRGAHDRSERAPRAVTPPASSVPRPPW